MKYRSGTTKFLKSAWVAGLSFFAMMFIVTPIIIYAIGLGSMILIFGILTKRVKACHI